MSEVIDDPGALGVRLAEGVRPAGGNALEDDVHRRTQEHDRIEPRVELHLVRHASRDEQRAVGVLGEQRLDPILAPQLLRPGLADRGTSSLQSP